MFEGVLRSLGALFDKEFIESAGKGVKLPNACYKREVCITQSKWVLNISLCLHILETLVLPSLSASTAVKDGHVTQFWPIISKIGSGGGHLPVREKSLEN